jgi:uncharacterized protein with PIN domain
VISVRFYAELNQFLPPARRQIPFTCSFDPHTSVKHVIETLGVPHTEVDLILLNGESIPFSHPIHEGDRISIYPVFESLDITPILRLRPKPLRRPAFILDVHLGRLACYLRLLGFDTLYRRNCDDEELAQISSCEKRILLTRDRALLKRSIVTHGCLVHNTDPRQQVIEVMHRFQLSRAAKPFCRCLSCNGVLEAVAKEAILDRLLPGTRRQYDEFHLCKDCGRVFWKGPHYKKMVALLESLI